MEMKTISINLNTLFPVLEFNRQKDFKENSEVCLLEIVDLTLAIICSS